MGDQALASKQLNKPFHKPRRAGERTRYWLLVVFHLARPLIVNSSHWLRKGEGRGQVHPELGSLGRDPWQLGLSTTLHDNCRDVAVNHGLRQTNSTVSHRSRQ